MAVAGQQAGGDSVRLAGEMDQDATALRHHTWPGLLWESRAQASWAA